MLDRLLFWRIDKRRSIDELVELGFDRALVERVDRMVADVRVQAPGPADREARAADGGRRLPLPAASAGFRARVTRRVVGRRPLYVVATPIGNLGDVTLRALEVLRAVPLIAAEDTRITRRLLDRHEIETRTISYHARSGPARAAELLEHLRGGDGPGPRDRCRDAGRQRSRAASSSPRGRPRAARVVPIPGASAVLAAVVASGIAGPRWSFEGFLPRSGRERRERLARIAADERGTVIYEAPSRVAATLRDLAAACGAGPAGGGLPRADEAPRGDRPGAARRAGRRAADGEITLRGEFAIVVGEQPGGTPASAATEAAAGAALSAARADVERLVADGTSRGDAARRVAAATGIPRRQLYGAPADR